jgi:AcrR family transcriptional regulator
LIHPDAQQIMLRDQEKATRQINADSQRQNREFIRQYRARLRDQVETRMSLAVEQTRMEERRARQLARAENTRAEELPAGVVGDTPEPITPGRSVLTAWRPPATPSGEASVPTTSSLTAPVRHVAAEVPRRTREIMQGEDDLVKDHIARGLPQSVAMFMALLMLHIPSLAVGSLILGVAMVRGHRTRLGAAFLSVSVLLGIVIFFVLPW